MATAILRRKYLLYKCLGPPLCLSCCLRGRRKCLDDRETPISAACSGRHFHGTRHYCTGQEAQAGRHPRRSFESRSRNRSCTSSRSQKTGRTAQPAQSASQPEPP
ncbi:hypothetical protein C8034_v008336 [Colletotrichum sidae]|uniref:Uncharacterized protein n=1 Tax=Colletotrichum sidae TaxID=1347389 RepID=A0A4R8TQR1_9PEZI|nr:hypothetical protein C8034_v008336 [Colletotrichum sidae]